MRDVSELAVPFIPIQYIRLSFDTGRSPIVRRAGEWVTSEGSLSRIESKVVGNKQIQIPVIVEVRKCCPETPELAAYSCLGRHIPESAVSFVVPQRIRSITSHVHVRE